MPISKPISIPTTQSPKSIARLVNTKYLDKACLEPCHTYNSPRSSWAEKKCRFHQISQEEEGDLGDSQGRKFLRQPPILIHGREATDQDWLLKSAWNKNWKTEKKTFKEKTPNTQNMHLLGKEGESLQSSKGAPPDPIPNLWPLGGQTPLKLGQHHLRQFEKSKSEWKSETAESDNCQVLMLARCLR